MDRVAGPIPATTRAVMLTTGTATTVSRAVITPSARVARTAATAARGSCDTSGTNDWGTGNGWCSSDLDDHVGDTSTASACWTMCEIRTPTVATDWTPDGECWCQNDCQCMEDADDGDIHLITSSAVASLPNTCVSACPAEEAAFEDCLSKQGRLDDEYFGDDDCGGGGDYFLANGGQSCDDACASSGGCDLAAITAAAASTSACGSVLDDLGVSYANGPSGYYDDNSGCTTHPGQGGWAQVYWNPTCDEVNSDGNRQRVCAWNCGPPGGGGDDDDDDDDFSPNTCADVQEWLSKGECADGPSVCRAEYDAWVECHYEDMAQSFWPPRRSWPAGRTTARSTASRRAKTATPSTATARLRCRDFDDSSRPTARRPACPPGCHR